VATDTIYSDTPAVDCGVTAAQYFVGRKTLVADAYPLRRDRDFINALEDNVRERGAMDTLISDRAQVEISKKVQDFLHSLIIGSYQSEPYHQHQNFAENRFGINKQWTNRVLNMSGAPASCWLLALVFVIVLLNHLASPALGGQTPLCTLTGQTTDISHLLCYQFYQKIYYKIEDSAKQFPSHSNEKLGYWVGFADNVGDAMTWKILTEDNHVIYRSSIRPADDDSRNLRVDPVKGELSSSKPIIFVRSKEDDEGLTDSPRPMATLQAEDLIGRTFLKSPESNGERLRAKIVRTIYDPDEETKDIKEAIKFLLNVGEGRAEEIITYHQLMEHIEQDIAEELDPDTLFKFRSISAHQGPLNPEHHDYKGSKYNVLVNWETGESTFEPLN